MIGSLRKKFISISIVSILVVFSGIFFFLLIFTRMQTNRSLDLLTDTISSNDGIFPRFDPSKHHLPIQLLFRYYGGRNAIQYPIFFRLAG